MFHEGALVRAVRHGHWVILDELNLAPTDVLEALNRLLDDNRELFVPELQETIQPHPHFMLFGTQNPAGAYAGEYALLLHQTSVVISVVCGANEVAQLICTCRTASNTHSS